MADSDDDDNFWIRHPASPTSRPRRSDLFNASFQNIIINTVGLEDSDDNDIDNDEYKKKKNLEDTLHDDTTSNHHGTNYDNQASSPSTTQQDSNDDNYDWSAPITADAAITTSTTSSPASTPTIVSNTLVPPPRTTTESSSTTTTTIVAATTAEKMSTTKDAEPGSNTTCIFSVSSKTKPLQGTDLPGVYPSKQRPGQMLLSKASRATRTRRGYLIGMIAATLFSFGTFVRPIHFGIPILMAWYQYPTPWIANTILGILLVFAMIPTSSSSTNKTNTKLLWKRFGSYLLLQPLLNYFEYDEIVENSPIHIRESIHDGKRYIFALQPHGIVPFCSILSNLLHTQRKEQEFFNSSTRKERTPPSSTLSETNASSEDLFVIPTAVARLVLWTPILRHVYSLVQDCVSASRNELRQVFKRHGGVRIYVGGTSDILQCTSTKEVLHLTKRMKQVLQFAITSGIDIVPVYLFGNTSIYDVITHPWLIYWSQLLQFPVTYFYGPYRFPIPKSRKLLLVSGQPLGIQRVKKPGPTLLKYWLNRYCEEVQRLFDEYKERVPEYKKKELEIY